MKPGTLSTFHYILYFGFALLVTTPEIVQQRPGIKEFKVEVIKKQQPVAMENSAEILHGEVLFGF